jgi:Tfp pilus assembly protein PilF
LGLAQRQQGQFTLAQAAFEAAISQDPQALDPHWNLAILWDLYLAEPAKAQALYQRCLALSPADAPLLNKWLAELKTRKPAPGAPAGADTATSPVASPATASTPAAPAAIAAKDKS